MARKPISDTIKKRLYAESNNQCAFPGCEEKLFDDGRHDAEMCHIEATKPV